MRSPLGLAVRAGHLVLLRRVWIRGTLTGSGIQRDARLLEERLPVTQLRRDERCVLLGRHRELLKLQCAKTGLHIRSLYGFTHLAVELACDLRRRADRP